METLLYRLPENARHIAAFEKNPWVATDHGLYRFQNPSWQKVSVLTNQVACLCADETELWYGGWDTDAIGCLRRAPNGKGYRTEKRIPFPLDEHKQAHRATRGSRIITALALDSRSVWAATPGYVARFDRREKRWREVFAFDSTLYALTVQDESVWVGTFGGLVELRSRNGRYEWARTLFKGYGINSIAIGPDKTLYAGGCQSSRTPTGGFIRDKKYGFVIPNANRAFVWRVRNGVAEHVVSETPSDGIVSDVQVLPLRSALYVSTLTDKIIGKPSEPHLSVVAAGMNPPVKPAIAAPFRRWARVEGDLWLISSRDGRTLFRTSNTL